MCGPNGSGCGTERIKKNGQISSKYFVVLLVAEKESQNSNAQSQQKSMFSIVISI